MGKSVLHVGCGTDILPIWMTGFSETRLDIDQSAHPDIVANMTDMGEIGTFDVVYCCHAIEHLYPHEVQKALSEFRRVLNDTGVVVLFVPDLEGVQATNDVLFESPAGKITGLDLMYGLRHRLKDEPYMAHKTGFVQETLKTELEQSGFRDVVVKREKYHNLSAVGVK